MSAYNEYFADKISIKMDEIQKNAKFQAEDLQKNVKKALSEALDSQLIERKTNENINFSLKLSNNVSKMNNRSLVEVKPILEKIEETVTEAYEA